jgi:hypothetical protein
MASYDCHYSSGDRSAYCDPCGVGREEGLMKVPANLGYRVAPPPAPQISRGNLLMAAALLREQEKERQLAAASAPLISPEKEASGR